MALTGQTATQAPQPMQVSPGRPKAVETRISTPRPLRVRQLPPTRSQTRAQRPHITHWRSWPVKRARSAPYSAARPANHGEPGQRAARSSRMSLRPWRTSGVSVSTLASRRRG